MAPRFLYFLLSLAPISLLAQDHVNDATAAAAAAVPAPAPSPAQGKQGPGRGKGGGGGGGGRGGDTSAAVAEMHRIIADPDELAKGQKLFETHCSTCHGPKGEGSRGPTLAQPSLPRGGDDPSLVRIVQGGIPNTEMPRVMLQPGEAPFIAAYVRKLGQIPIEKVPGDPAKGAELFSTKGACLSCHTRDGQGIAFGPDLTNIGQRRSAAFLRRSLVDPAADVPQSFEPYRADVSLPLNFSYVQAKTKDGKEFAGIRVNEDSYSIQFRDLTGEIHSFYKKELAELKKGQTSPMPVYGALLTPAELDDMVAYLVSLRGKKA